MGVDAEIALNKCKFSEPHLVIFVNPEETEIEQIFLCAEDNIIMEVQNSTKLELIDALVHLMAAYYVFNVAYPSVCKTTFYFLQDIIMGKGEAGARRPIRYSTFLTGKGLN